VVERRARFNLAKANKRLHLVEGFLAALTDLDQVVKTIRAANDGINLCFAPFASRPTIVLWATAPLSSGMAFMASCAGSMACGAAMLSHVMFTQQSMCTCSAFIQIHSVQGAAQVHAVFTDQDIADWHNLFSVEV